MLKGRSTNMRRIFKTIEDHLTECTTLEKGVWVHLQSPTKEEVDGLTTRFNLDPTFLPAGAFAGAARRRGIRPH